MLVPDQRMVSEISELLAKGQACSPPFVPFIFAPLGKEPWIPLLLEHKKARDGWVSRMKSMSSDLPLSFQAWILYRLRFIISDEVCAAWSPFGGLMAQINNLGITLNIAVSDNAGAALKYYDFLHTQLESHARSRSAEIDYFRLLSEEQIDIKRRSTKLTNSNEASPISFSGRNASRGENISFQSLCECSSFPFTF